MTIVRETPGVYIEEITGPGVIQGVSTSVAAFVGPTAGGASRRARQITSFDQFVELFGRNGDPHFYPGETPAYISFAVQGFFENRGQRAYIARVSNGRAAWAYLQNDDGGIEAVVRAITEGTHGDGVSLTTTASTRSWQLASTQAATVAADGKGNTNLPTGFAEDRSIQLSTDQSGFVVGDTMQISSVTQPAVSNPGDQHSVIGENIALQIVATSATGQPLQFTANNLPAGLAIDNSGLISGSPTNAGSSNVTVDVDEAGQVSTVAYTWDVRGPHPQVTNPGSQSTAVNAPVNLQIQATAEQGGTLQYSDNGTLPGNLSIDPNTGMISGTPNADEFSDVAVAVTENGGQPTIIRFGWVVGTPAEPTVVNPGDQETIVGTDVTLQVQGTAAGGGALQYADNGTLPAGLAIDNSGSITGQPTATGSNPVTITVDEAGNQSTVSFDWVVRDSQPQVTNPGNQATASGAPVNLQIQATLEGAGTLGYASTTLPPGLTIDGAGGVITGIPTATGFWDVAIEVDEDGGPITTVRFTWTVPDAFVSQVARVDGDWVLLSDDVPGPSGSSNGRPVRIADLAVGETRLRLDQPGGLPQVGTWVQAGSGASAITFVITRVEQSGFVTIEDPRRTRPLTRQEHGTLTSLSFDLGVAPTTGAAETFPELSLDPRSEHYLLGDGVVNSQYVVLEEPDQPLFTLPRTFGPAATPVTLANGADFDFATLSAADYEEALELLEPVDAVSMVCVPDAARYDGSDRVIRQAIHGAQLGHCLKMGDRIAIFDPPSHPEGGTLDELDLVENVVLDLRSERGFGALYYPWVEILDPRATPPRPPTRLAIPPSGHVAGVMARTDTERGVFKAPANATISEVLDVQRRLTDAQQGPLNVAGVNVLRVLPGSNRVNVWGARTTVDPYVTDWLYVNVRRLLLFIEESIQDGIRWAVFEPNNQGLWKALERVIRAFLREQWRAGALFGDEEDQAFRVRIDEALNPPSTRNKGYLYIEVKVAPSRPAEFIVVRIGLFDGGAEIEEV